MATSSSAIDDELQQLAVRLHRLCDSMAALTAHEADEKKRRKRALELEQPKHVVRSNQHIALLRWQYAVMYQRSVLVSSRMAALRQQALAQVQAQAQAQAQ